MLPIVRAVLELGGSGTGREITESVVKREGFPEELLSVTYEGRDKSVLIDRLDWARSYNKLGGVLDSPRRGLFLITDLGREIASLPDDSASQRLRDIDLAVRSSRRRKEADSTSGQIDDDEPPEIGDDSWKETLLTRLHQLSPDAFEHFVLYLLRAHGMQLQRVGGSGDEGIDGLGTAPIGPVLTRTIAVQAKRYEPSATIGREVVALFQGDAIAAGAEHGILVTTGRFSEPARRAALSRHPTIDLVDGEKLAGLCLDVEVGIQQRPVVLESFFDRFESL